MPFDALLAAPYLPFIYLFCLYGISGELAFCLAYLPGVDGFTETFEAAWLVWPRIAFAEGTLYLPLLARSLYRRDRIGLG